MHTFASNQTERVFKCAVLDFISTKQVDTVKVSMHANIDLLIQ